MRAQSEEIQSRMLQKGIVPRLGGIIFLPLTIISVLLLACFSSLFNNFLDLNLQTFKFNSAIWIISAFVLIYLVGIADDIYGVNYKIKFCVQIIAGICLFQGGLFLNNLHGFLGINQIPSLLSFFSTIFLTVLITNSINLIDGIDGLAAGITIVALNFYSFTFYSQGLHHCFLICIAALIPLYVFFYFNVFGKITQHNKIFMGDTGALTIGLLLTALSIRICQFQTPSPIFENLNTLNPIFTAPQNEFINPAMAAFSPLILPIFDLIRVFTNRISKKQNPFLPDQTHIHHKLLALGLSSNKVLAILILSSIIYILLNIMLSPFLNITLLLLLDFAVWIIANILLTRFIQHHEIKKTNPSSIK